MVTYTQCSQCYNVSCNVAKCKIYYNPYVSKNLNIGRLLLKRVYCIGVIERVGTCIGHILILIIIGVLLFSFNCLIVVPRSTK